MSSIVTKRIVECHKMLIERGIVRSSRQFVMELNYSPQSWSKVIKGERDVTIELIRKAIEVFHINPSFIFLGAGEPFIDHSPALNPVLTVAVDCNDEERILHVPIAAQAGYLEQFNDPVYMEELQSFTLPGFQYKHATYRAFDIAGDSMEPTIFQGEMVICSYVDPELWRNNLRNDYVYVIVCRGDIVIKRIQNRIALDGTIRLMSDNAFYNEYDLPIHDVQEIWFVKMKVSPFAHSKVTKRINMEDSIDDMKSIISSQSVTINNLNQTVERLLKNERIRR